LRTNVKKTYKEALDLFLGVLLILLSLFLSILQGNPEKNTHSHQYICSGTAKQHDHGGEIAVLMKVWMCVGARISL